MSQHQFQLKRNEKLPAEFRALQLVELPLRSFCIDFLLEEIFDKVNQDNLQHFKDVVTATSTSNDATRKFYHASTSNPSPEEIDVKLNSAHFNSKTFKFIDKSDVTPQMKNSNFSTAVAKWFVLLFYNPSHNPFCANANIFSNPFVVAASSINNNISGNGINNNMPCVNFFEGSSDFESCEIVARRKTEIVEKLVASGNIVHAFEIFRHLITHLSRMKSTSADATNLRKVVVGLIQGAFENRHPVSEMRSLTQECCIERNKNYARLLNHLHRTGFISWKIVNFVLYDLLHHFDETENSGKKKGESKKHAVASVSSSNNNKKFQFLDFHLFCSIVTLNETSSVPIYHKILADDLEEFCKYFESHMVKIAEIVEGLKKRKEIANQESDFEFVPYGNLMEALDSVLELEKNGWKLKRGRNDLADTKEQIKCEVNSAADSIIAKIQQKSKERKLVQDCLGFFKNNLAGFFYSNVQQVRADPLRTELRLPRLSVLALQSHLLSVYGMRDEERNQNVVVTASTLPPKSGAVNIYSSDLEAIDFYIKVLEHRKNQAMEIQQGVRRVA